MSKPDEAGALDREGLFRIVCREAFADGRIEEAEKEALETLQRFLRIQPEAATTILKQAKETAEAAGTDGKGALDPEKTFLRAAELAWDDGELEKKELQLLVGLSKVLGLPSAKAREILDLVCGPEPKATVIMQSSPENRVDPPPPEPPPPGPALLSTPKRGPDRGPMAQARFVNRVAGAGVLLLMLAWWLFLQLAPTPPSGRDPRPAPPPAGGKQRSFTTVELEAMKLDGFLTLSHEDRVSAMISMVKTDKGLLDLANSARVAGRLGELEELWIELLRSEDPRIQEETWDRMTTFTKDGKMEEKRVNIRVDDSAFKEQLLYTIRYFMRPDSPHLEALYRAYQEEDYPMTRMRIVRALGKIGGDEARGWIRKARENEGESGSYAAQEADKWLNGAKRRR